MSFCHFSHLKAIYPYLKMIKKKNAIYQFGNYPASKIKKFTVVCQMFFRNVKSSFSVKTLPIYIYIYIYDSTKLISNLNDLLKLLGLIYS